MKNLYLIMLLSLFMVNASYADENACDSGDQGGTGTDNDSCYDSTSSEGDVDEVEDCFGIC